VAWFDQGYQLWGKRNCKGVSVCSLVILPSCLGQPWVSDSAWGWSWPTLWSQDHIRFSRQTSKALSPCPRDLAEVSNTTQIACGLWEMNSCLRSWGDGSWVKKCTYCSSTEFRSPVSKQTNKQASKQASKPCVVVESEVKTADPWSSLDGRGSWIHEIQVHWETLAQKLRWSVMRETGHIWHWPLTSGSHMHKHVCIPHMCTYLHEHMHRNTHTRTHTHVESTFGVVDYLANPNPLSPSIHPSFMICVYMYAEAYELELSSKSFEVLITWARIELRSSLTVYLPYVFSYCLLMLGYHVLYSWVYWLAPSGLEPIWSPKTVAGTYQKLYR
jgi:hypothetical protein